MVRTIYWPPFWNKAYFAFKSSFQSTVESNCAIAVATLADWLKNFAPVFQSMRSKSKTNRTLDARLFPHFVEFEVTGNRTFA